VNPTLWFVVPAHGRLELARICLRQLRRTCDALEREGTAASAVVVSCDENLDTARQLGFGTVERDNQFLSRRYNDGIQLATDPRYNPEPADYVIPVGSDDWIHHRLFTSLPKANTVLAFQHASFVREDGQEMSSRFLNYYGGCGIRVYPRQVMAALDFRPADEDRRRGCDTSILTNLRRDLRNDLRVEYGNIDSRWIVDWKSPDQQLNRYFEIQARYRELETGDPFEMLAGVYPREALDDMAAHYTRELVAA
jgi:hypothetical protein